MDGGAVTECHKKYIDDVPVSRKKINESDIIRLEKHLRKKLIKNKYNLALTVESAAANKWIEVLNIGGGYYIEPNYIKGWLDNKITNAKEFKCFG